jgi:TRAP-type uncharacterized transport system fused permease subunit
VRGLLGPHEERVAAAVLANRHAVAHGQVRQVAVHGVALALVAVLAALVLPVSTQRKQSRWGGVSSWFSLLLSVVHTAYRWCVYGDTGRSARTVWSCVGACGVIGRGGKRAEETTGVGSQLPSCPGW